jgi:protein gp37
MSRFNPQKGDKIEWSQWSWSPVTGCEYNCEYCYAHDIADGIYSEGFAPTLRIDRLDAPMNTPLPRDPNNRHVFVCSMGELFGDWVPQEWINFVLQGAWDAPQWTFIFLTKNPKRLPSITFPPNAWVGTTVDVQARVAPAQEAFKSVKASVKFLSCEPLQESIKFSDLSMFNWMIIGGRSKNSKLPAFKPPHTWIDSLVKSARVAELKVYQKPNLGVDDGTRLTEYPDAKKAYITRDVFDFDDPRSP